MGEVDWFLGEYGDADLGPFSATLQRHVYIVNTQRSLFCKIFE